MQLYVIPFTMSIAPGTGCYISNSKEKEVSGLFILEDLSKSS
jgi:hypothetical protein